MKLCEFSQEVHFGKLKVDGTINYGIDMNGTVTDHQEYSMDGEIVILNRLIWSNQIRIVIQSRFAN